MEHRKNKSDFTLNIFESVMIFIVIMQFALIALKACNLISFNWWIVLSPSMLYLGTLVASLIVLAIFNVVGNFVLSVILFREIRKNFINYVTTINCKEEK